MKIVVDAMGGDNAPVVEVEGAVEALRDGKGEEEVALVGDEPRIRAELDRLGASGISGLTVVHAPEHIEMGKDPVRQVRSRKQASINVASRLVKDGQADGLVSAGNTGGVVASTTFQLGRIKGVRRPAIATFLPSPSGGAILLDVGANSDCIPEHLLQFAKMGEIYARRVLDRKDPKVGLLNIGEEKTKGNKLVQATHELLEGAPLNFVGNVEGRDIFQGAADVVVCDGFVGNVVLKFSESVSQFITGLIRDEVGESLRSQMGALLMKPVFRSLGQQLDYAEYGGAPLLGLRGAVIIAHGSSSPKAIKNAIRVAGRFARKRITELIRTELQDDYLAQVSS